LRHLASSAFIRVLCRTIAERRWGVAAGLANLRSGTPGYFVFEPNVVEQPSISVARVRFDSGSCLVALDAALPDSPRLDYMIRRLVGTLPLLAACHDVGNGETWLNLDDIGQRPGLAFSAAGDAYHLVPDPIFIAEHAYRNIARTYLMGDPPWSDRAGIAFWRGSTTGVCEPGAWQELDRVRLCAISTTRPDLFDVGFAAMVQRTFEDATAIRRAGYMQPPVPEAAFIRYRYQIDIDGNSNSWPGLFGKLLTASPVLKVASSRGYRQWYYDRLIPWENFVPVSSTMDDLVEKTEWLIAHDAEAQRIGAAGRALALSMDMRSELQRARETVAKALTRS
jgi:hypothetical protein